jgi:hypothetical protein
MALFEMIPDTRFIKLIFDDMELDVIRAACASASEREHGLMDETADAGIEQYAGHAKKAGESDMADMLVSLFKPGREILIEREDIEPVIECLKIYGESLQQEDAMATKGVIEKIRRCCRSA